MRESTKILVELYKRGDYSQLGLFSKQLQALQKIQSDQITELLYGGGARGGKSWLFCLWQAMQRLSMPKSNGLIARKEYSTLRDTTLLTFFKVCQFLKLENGVDFNYNAQTSRCEFYNGSLVFFREIKYIPSDPEFDRLGSYDLTDLFLDEVQEIHFKAISVLRGRLSVLEGEGWQTKPKMAYGCNPKKNWIKSEFVDKHKNNSLPKEKAFISSLATDNPYVKKSYIDNLMKADEITRQRLLFGNFDYDDDPRSLLFFNDITDLFTNSVKEDRENKFITCDIARLGKDKTVLIVWFGLVAYIYNKNILRKNTIDEVVKLLQDNEELHQIKRSNQIIDQVGLGAGVKDYHKGCKGFTANARPITEKQEKNIEKKQNTIVNNYISLKDQCIFKFADYTKKGKIKIVCYNEDIKQEIIEELEQIKQKDVDNDRKLSIISKDEMKDNIGRSPDFLDSLIMRMYFELKREKKFKMILF